MPELKICQFPDPVLRKISNPVEHFNRELESFIDRLIETMKHQPGGIGIAAPQVGVLKRVAVVDVSPKVKGATMKVLINPVIIALQEAQVLREGCMSLPDFTANVKRACRIHIKFQDRNLKWQEAFTSGIEARCIQHEIDHLNGILFVDRVSSLKSDVFPRKKYL